MWPLLIVNYVKLIELKRLLVYSKESCNNLANIIHGHRRFRLKRPLNDLHSAATGGKAAWQTRKGPRRGGASVSVWWSPHPGLTHNVTISGSDPGVWVRHVTWGPLHCHKIARQSPTSQGNMRLPKHCIVCVFCILDINAARIVLRSLARVSSHQHTRLWPLGHWTVIIGFPSQARPSPRSPWWGLRVLWKYFYCAQNNFCQHKYIFPQRFQSRRGKNQVV